MIPGRLSPAAILGAPPSARTSGSAAYTLNPDTGMVTRPDGTRAQLSKRERDVLHVLHMFRGRWVARKTIVELVWSGHADRTIATIYVQSIRRKCGADVIDTAPIRSRGYGVGVE